MLHTLILVGSLIPGFLGDPVPESLAPLLSAPRSPLETIVERWAADRRDVGRRFPVEASERRWEKLRAFGREWRERLDALDFDALDTEGKVDYLLLDNSLKDDLARLDREEREAKQFAPLVPFAPPLVALVKAKQNLEPVDPESAAELLAKLKSQIAEAKKAAEAPQGGRRHPQAGRRPRRRGRRGSTLGAEPMVPILRRLRPHLLLVDEEPPTARRTRPSPNTRPTSARRWAVARGTVTRSTATRSAATV